MFQDDKRRSDVPTSELVTAVLALVRAVTRVCLQGVWSIYELERDQAVRAG